MKREWHKPEREAWVMRFMVCAATLLLAHVVYIQSFARDKYIGSPPGKALAVHGERGRIVDRTYRVLAESVRARTVGVIPAEIHKWATRDGQADGEGGEMLPHNPEMIRAARAISVMLELSYDEVLQRLCRQAPYVALKARVDVDRAEQLARLGIPGLCFDPVERREYPFGRMAGAVLGWCNAEQVPIWGIERWHRQITEGEAAPAGVRYDSWGRRILCSGMNGRPGPAPGKDLVLRLDVGVQQIAEKVLDECVATRHPDGANVVVMSARDGAILALSCRPNFDPNRISGATRARGQIDVHNLVNRAVSRPTDPGSTFKLLTVAAALDCGAITESSTFYCKGTEEIGGAPLRCWGKWATKGHGYLNPGGVLANSCNLCAAHIALRLGPKRFHEFLVRCGIGQAPRAGFPGEHAGRLLPPEDMRRRDLACLGFGQGVQVSDLQLAAALCAIFNGGLLYQPQIVGGYIDPNTHETYMTRPRVVRRVCKETTSEIMRRLAARVVDSGTGRRARIPGVAVGGKTATSQIWDAKRHKWLDGPQDYVMSFVIAAPVDRRPDFVIVVSVERPRIGDAGSDVAAPMAREIAEYLLGQPGLFPADEETQMPTVAKRPTGPISPRPSPLG